MRAELGEFVYNEYAFEKKLGAREVRPSTILESGARYEGEWLVGTQTRQGKGI